MNNLSNNEVLIRLFFSLGVFAIMAIFEIIAPKRKLNINKFYRWSNNLGVVIVDVVLMRIMFPVAGVGVAIYAINQNWGIFNSTLHISQYVPQWLIVLICVLILDAVIWGQHLLFHRLPLLWRLHRMHHADLDFDVTTALRFHPIEIFISLLIKLAAIILLGAPVLAVIIFEVLLNATAMFNHANINLPKKVDSFLRIFLVTPDMHRIHHSIHPHELNSNYGFCLSVWDRTFKTYSPNPQDGHLQMQIGIKNFREQADLRLDKMLIQPFK